MTPNGRFRGRMLAVVAAVLLVGASCQFLQSGLPPDASSASVPLDVEHRLHVPVSLRELPVPPTVPSNGVCPNPTGCVSGNWGALGSPGFFWDPHAVLLGATYAGAPSAPNPASIYSGPQVLLIKTDGGTFPNGDAWKCL